MENQMTYESRDRQWFALSSSGNLWALGDCGDFDAAEEIANDLEIDAVWIADAETAMQWSQTIQNKLAEIGV
jgi:hypothetical protein